MLRYLEVRKDKIRAGDEIYIPDPGGRVQNEGMEHEYGWQKIERGGRFDSIIGMEVMEIQLPLRREETYWWEDVVRECERILELEGHAENPLSSNLPNAIRETRGVDMIKDEDGMPVKIKNMHYKLESLGIDFLETQMFIFMKGQVRCWNCNVLFPDDRVSVISTNRGQYGICKKCALKFKSYRVSTECSDLCVKKIKNGE